MSISEQPKVGRPVTNSTGQLLDRLIQAGVDILNEQGADADLSVNQLAQRAKISKRTVYTVVAGKEELISHIMCRGIQTATSVLEQPVGTAAEARAVLGQFLKVWVAFACGPEAIGIYVMAIRERTRYPTIGAAYYRTRDVQGKQQLVAWMERMQAKHFIATDDPILTADLALTMAAAERQRVLALGVDVPLTPDQLDRRIEAALQFVFRETAA